MIVQVRFFASLVDRTGRATEEVEIAPGTDVNGLWLELQGRHAALVDLPYRPLVACDLAYAAWDRSLDGVREVAFLPPVSGG